MALENMMDPDSLANAGKDWLDQVEAYIDGMPSGPVKSRARLLVKILHAAAFALKSHAVDANIISPFSGGDPEKP